MSNVGAIELLLMIGVIVVLAIVFVVIPYWRIFRKAGFQPALSFLMIVPVVNIGMLYFLAFTEWPSLKQTPK